jgi:hypothetical protein
MNMPFTVKQNYDRTAMLDLIAVSNSFNGAVLAAFVQERNATASPPSGRSNLVLNGAVQVSYTNETCAAKPRRSGKPISFSRSALRRHKYQKRIDREK